MQQARKMMKQKTPFIRGRLIPTEALERYVTHDDVRTAGGNRAIDNDDVVAQTLRGLSLDEVYRLAAEILAKKAGGSVREADKELRDRYEHLNPGMQRMNLGNILRAQHRAYLAAKKGKAH